MVGHKKQQDFFRRAVASNQLSHAYILSGAEGIGKKLFAKNMAKGLLCENRVPFGCGDCPACRQVDENVHPDYYLFETKDDLKIESVRKVADASSMTAYRGGWRVVIFDNAHILSQGGADAANAMLKTLEEPGEKTIFFLITHRAERMLATVRSRSLEVHFSPLEEHELLTVLKNVDDSRSWEGVVPYAGGSVTQAQLLVELNVLDIVSAVSKKDLVKLGNHLLGITDKDALAVVIRLMQQQLIIMYKKEQNPDYSSLVRYYTVAIKNLDYNINISIFLLELYKKTEEMLR